nr:hypothetical protein [Tanacetum cinerariifolium]
MSSLFADSHNMVAILAKSDAAEVKRSDDVTRLQALVDKKKIVISEDNQIGDLSTHTTRYISPALTQKVFANMRRVGKGFSGVETPLFEGMLDVREITEEQVQADVAVAAAVQETIVEDVTNEAIPSTPTPLILPSPPSHDIPSTSQEQSLPPQQPQTAQKLEILKLKARVKMLERANQVKSSKFRRLKKVGTSKRIESSDDIEDVFNQGRMIDDLDKDEGIELIVDQVKDADTAKTKGRHAAEQLITDVVTAATSQVSAVNATISAAKPSIPGAAPTSVATYTRRRKGVIIRDPEEELSFKSPAKTLKLKDKGKAILIETPKPIKKKDQIELDAEYARKLHEEINKDHEEINKDIDWDATIDHVKQKSKENP